MKAGNQRGMIDHLANLVCSAGHIHLADDPDAFVGKPCGTQREGKRCTRALRRRLADPEAELLAGVEDDLEDVLA